MEPSFTINDYVRLIEAAASCGDMTRKPATAQSGDVQAGLGSSGHLHRFFNDPRFCPEPPLHVNQNFGGSVHGRNMQHERSEPTLQERYRELGSKFAYAYTKWMCSQLCKPTQFSEFSAREPVLLYLFERLQTSPGLEADLKQNFLSTPHSSPGDSSTSATSDQENASRKRRNMSEAAESSEHDAFYSWLGRIESFVQDEKITSYSMAENAALRILDTQRVNGVSTDRIQEALQMIRAKLVELQN
mmetsp:Transcript_9234/g.27800  ORF Transcript_9234/g.27800 Transcript_9234/m.27800 type:complete len:245 (-) Transcript_9234:56-790(-)